MVKIILFQTKPNTFFLCVCTEVVSVTESLWSKYEQRISTLWLMCKKNNWNLKPMFFKRRIVMNLLISAFTIHNIIKRFMEYEGISVHIGQEHKYGGVVETCDLQFLMPLYCIKNNHKSIADITIWTRDFSKMMYYNMGYTNAKQNIAVHKEANG